MTGVEDSGRGNVIGVKTRGEAGRGAGGRAGWFGPAPQDASRMMNIMAWFRARGVAVPLLRTGPIRSRPIWAVPCNTPRAGALYNDDSRARVCTQIRDPLFQGKRKRVSDQFHGDAHVI
jgi:hypothetical protein